MSLETETIEIKGLPLGTLKSLDQISREKGQTPEEYARHILEAELLSERSFDEILAPIRQGFADNRMTEAELAELVEQERQSLWQEKHGHK